MEIVMAEEDFTVIAKDLVRAEIINAIEDAPGRGNISIPKFNVKIAWACKTLQNWKAFVISDLPDELMYEVTYNGDKKETYIDTYEKLKQTVVRDGD